MEFFNTTFLWVTVFSDAAMNESYLLKNRITHVLNAAGNAHGPAPVKTGPNFYKVRHLIFLNSCNDFLLYIGMSPQGGTRGQCPLLFNGIPFNASIGEECMLLKKVSPLSLKTPLLINFKVFHIHSVQQISP